MSQNRLDFKIRTFCSVVPTARSCCTPHTRPRLGRAAARVSVAIRRSDTGLISALLNLQGGRKCRGAPQGVYTHHVVVKQKGGGNSEQTVLLM